MRALILMTAAAPSFCVAQPVQQAPWTTGAELLKLFDRPSGPENSRNTIALQQLHQYQAEAYINGVHDATEGKAWCYSPRYNPHQDELRADVVSGLRALSAEQLKRPASELIVNIWRDKWPCRSKP